MNPTPEKFKEYLEEIQDTYKLRKNKIEQQELKPRETKKGKLRVGLIVIPPFIKKKEIQKNGITSIIYEGLVYEIWSKIKQLLDYEIEEIPLSFNYDDAVNEIVKGNIDLLVGNVWIFEERAQKINFTRPIFLSKLVLAHSPLRSNLEIYLETLLKRLTLPILSLVILGIMFGIILHYVEPERGFVRSIWTTIASFLGEAGYLFENSRLRLSGMFVAFIIMLIAFNYTLYLQASATTDILLEQTRDDFSLDTINTKLFINPEGFDIGEILKKKYNIRYKNVNVAPDKIAEYYLANKEKYDGYIAEYEQIKLDVKKYKQIVMSQRIYGYEENAFGLRINDLTLLYDINIAISKLQNDNTIKDICVRYIGEEDANLCVL